MFGSDQRLFVCVCVCVYVFFVCVCCVRHPCSRRLQVWKYLWNRLRAVRVEYKLQGFFEAPPRSFLSSCVYACVQSHTSMLRGQAARF